MFFGKKKKDDDLKNPSGFGAVLHKTVMFLTYPFRKPLGLVLIVLLIVGAVYAVPVFVYKVEPKTVHLWYAEKIKVLQKTDLSQVSDKFSQIMTQIPLLKEGENNKGTDRLAEAAPTQKEIRRQMFKAAAGGAKGHRVDVLAQEADDVVSVEMPKPMAVEEADMIKVTEVTQPVEKKDSNSYEDRPVIVKKISEQDGNLLRYLPEPEKISGNAKVYNANELEVGGTYLFLYGIYSNPKTARGVKAAVFLRDALREEKVVCNILAYTADNVATGECFVEGISINKTLVERGYSDRVALQ